MDAPGSDVLCTALFWLLDECLDLEVGPAQALVFRCLVVHVDLDQLELVSVLVGLDGQQTNARVQHPALLPCPGRPNPGPPHCQHSGGLMVGVRRLPKFCGMETQ